VRSTCYSIKKIPPTRIRQNKHVYAEVRAVTQNSDYKAEGRQIQSLEYGGGNKFTDGNSSKSVEVPMKTNKTWEVGSSY
jgi:hypothetical protein